MPCTARRKMGRVVVPLCLVFAVIALAGGCTKPSRYTDENIKEHDSDTTFRITETEKGFRILVNYEEYQWWPSRGRSHQGCRDRLVQLAEEHAKGVGRKIAEIDEKKIRVDSGRNILSGVTTCSAVYSVEWLQQKSGKSPGRGNA